MEDAIKTLESSGNFVVLRRFSPVDAYADLSGRPGIQIGAVADVETTGLNASKDKLIELGMVKFEYDPVTGDVGRILGTFQSVQDPGFALTEETTRITGIRTEDVQGQSIDSVAVDAFISDVSTIVAHNASLDRKFCEAMFPSFAGKDWACSYTEGPWTELMMGSGKLEFLAFKSGVFYDAHRALVDAQVTLHVLAHAFPGAVRPMLSMCQKSARPSYRIWATRAPIAKKDILKSRGYRWNDGEDGNPKAWWKDLSEQDFPAEKNYLASEIYAKEPPYVRNIVVDTLSARDRFSVRNGERLAGVPL